MLLLGGIATAQGRGAGAAKAPASRPDGDLLQVMRGIVFSNANLIFDAQTRDPGAPVAPQKQTERATATEISSNLYKGWEGVENAAVALIESADLLLKPGRVCGNGARVPVERAEWVKLTEDLRTAGRSALAAARAKDREKMVDVAGEITEACSACHGPSELAPALGASWCLP